MDHILNLPRVSPYTYPAYLNLQVQNLMLEVGKKDGAAKVFRSAESVQPEV